MTTLPDIDAALAADWKAHTKSPEDVRQRLVDRLTAPLTAPQVIATAALACHVFGEHLGDWIEGLEYLDTLRAAHPNMGSDAESRVARQAAILRRCASDDADLCLLADSDRFYVTVLAMPALALHEPADRAARALEDAEILLMNGDGDRRLLAVVTANLICDLLERYDLKPGQRDFLTVISERSGDLWHDIGGAADKAAADYRLLQVRLLEQRPLGYGSGRYARSTSIAA